MRGWKPKGGQKLDREQGQEQAKGGIGWGDGREGGKRAVRWQEWITVDPEIMMGKPVIRGTRIPVDLILEKLAAGERMEELLAAHPRLRREAVLAAIAFATEVLRSDLVYPFEEEGSRSPCR